MNHATAVSRTSRMQRESVDAGESRGGRTILVRHPRRSGKQSCTFGGAGNPDRRGLCGGSAWSRGRLLAGGAGPARRSRHHQRSDAVGSPSQQRIADLSLPNAAASRVQGPAQGFDFARRRDRGKRQGFRRGIVCRAPGLHLPRRHCLAEHGLEDDERAPATEHQGRQSRHASDPQDRSLGRRISEDADDFRPRYGATEPR